LLAGSAAESTSGTVELRQNGQVVGSDRVTLAKDSAPRLSFRISSDEAVNVEARYLPEGFDALASDNVAWLHLPRARPLSVFAHEALGSVRHAVAAIEGVELYPGANGEKLGGYDVLITDREADLAIPSRVLCTFELIRRNWVQWSPSRSPRHERSIGAGTPLPFNM
jgi:hypothetical protein